MDAPFEYQEYIEHHVPKRTYFAVFGALMLLTLMTVAVAFVDLGRFNVLVALAVAVVKATMVVLFFMHVKYSSRLVQLVVVASLVWLGFLFGITMVDYLSRGWLMAPPIVR
jgi:cytochrome c oxidase subunit 4